MTNFEARTDYNRLHETGGEARELVYQLYIDVVFLVNLVMDVIVLVTVRTLLKVRTSVLRVIMGAVIGALWACLMAVWPIYPVFVQMALTYLGVGSLMVKVAFNTKGGRELIKGVLGMYLAAVALGGTMYALYQHTRFGYYVEQLIRGSVLEGMPLIILILLAAGAYFGNRYLWINLLEVRKQKSSLYEVTLIYKETVVKAIGLLDTGNHLYEPMSGRPVHVVSERIWNELYEEGNGLLLIPYHTVGTEEGMMQGIFIDSMEIQGEEGKRVIIKALIARSPHCPAKDGSYEILLHEDN